MTDTGSNACTPPERDKATPVQSFRHGQGIPWTYARVVELRRMVEEGLSSTQIAAELGGVTRNAVIGKCTRLGLRLSGSPGEYLRTPQPRKPRASRRTAFRAPAVSAPPIAPAEPVPAAAPPQCCPVDLLSLTNSSCRWPVTESSPWLFCGDATADLENGRPWCAYHHRIGHDRRSEAA